jgi:hypothetical protein
MTRRIGGGQGRAGSDEATLVHVRAEELESLILQPWVERNPPDRGIIGAAHQLCGNHCG